MSKVSIATNQEPKFDQQLQAIAAFWEKDEKWWLAPNTNSTVTWCFDNRVAIVALHSSEDETPIFQLECDGCHRWYKHCMFSNRERKSDWPADKGIGTDPYQFEVQNHIHCNRSGKKTSGEGYMSLEIPTSRRQVKEAVVDDIAPLELQFTVKKKMSQKERKAAQNSASERDTAW